MKSASCRCLASSDELVLAALGPNACPVREPPAEWTIETPWLDTMSGTGALLGVEQELKTRDAMILQDRDVDIRDERVRQKDKPVVTR